MGTSVYGLSLASHALAILPAIPSVASLKLSGIYGQKLKCFQLGQRAFAVLYCCCKAERDAAAEHSEGWGPEAPLAAAAQSPLALGSKIHSSGGEAQNRHVELQEVDGRVAVLHQPVGCLGALLYMETEIMKCLNTYLLPKRYKVFLYTFALIRI